MKILMLGLFDPGKNDASKVHFVEIVNAFTKLRHTVEILIPKGTLSHRILPENIIRHWLSSEYSENPFSVFLISICQIFEYARLIDESFDCVYVRWRVFPALFLKIINRIKSIRPIVVSEHNGWVDLEVRLQRNAYLFPWIGKTLQVLDALSADAIITVTDGIRDYLSDCGINQSKIYVVGNGTNINHYFPVQFTELLKKKLLGINGYVLGFMGNISKWQGLEDLLITFAELRRERNDIYLLIIGSGLYFDELMVRVHALGIQDYTFIKSDIPYEDSNQWINIMDIALAPKSKNLDSVGYSPLKIRDYAACGRPVVSTNVRGIKELEQFGWLKTYDPDQKDSLANLVRGLLGSRKMLNEMSSKAREYAVKEFSWINIAEKIVKIIAIR
jgi:glycosyltransferase involved in cell wall biosynthesis